MGIVTFGTFTFLKIGIQGAIFQMISHGLVSAAMFLCVGVVYDRMHTRDISAYGGLVRNMPYYAFAFMIFTLGSVGLPGTSGFVGELMVLMAAFQVNGPMALFLGSGMILGAAYALWLYRRVVFGELTKPELSKIIDLTKTEKCVFAPIALAVVFFGINPGPILKISDKAVTKLVAPYNRDRLGATDGMPSLAFMKKTLASIKGIFNDDKLTA